MRVISIVLERVLRRQARILSYQNQILERIDDMSEVLDQVKDFAAKIDAATNAIAIRIQTLIDKMTRLMPGRQLPRRSQPCCSPKSIG